jgi:hypothetical protein
MDEPAKPTHLPPQWRQFSLGDAIVAAIAAGLGGLCVFLLVHRHITELEADSLRRLGILESRLKSEPGNNQLVEEVREFRRRLESARVTVPCLEGLIILLGMVTGLLPVIAVRAITILYRRASQQFERPGGEGRG